MPAWNFGPAEQEFAEAGLDPTRWVQALTSVAAATGSFGAVMLPLSGDALPNVPYTENVSRVMEDYFRDGWHSQDERMRTVPTLTQCGVADDFDGHSADEIAKHPYYQEFLAPHGLRWYAGVKVACGDDLWAVALQRTIDQGPFSADEKDELARISSRLSTGAAIARALSASAAAGALEAFEMSGTAVVLINRHGHVFKANASAERLLVDDIRIVKGQLTARDTRATTALNRALHNLLWRPTSGLSAPVALPRATGRPLLAYPARLSNSTANALADCQAMVILIDPDSRSSTPETNLRTVFRLTQAEARLATQLALGESLENVADQFGIGKETARSQLKSIFAKTGVHRQAELVAVLAKLL
ncbi:helix-turn-helix transcriptional regulator [Bradyrhizobium sp. AUGA SZCCT0431]|uniref:helix-turn-helix transcriptional regulator n=1 Tax=Bradyrhizobium sp. AUGA SZCCT0431 TaxID=2807674 RepID=UPI001BA8FEF8|nr:helix-turn-helix transcriptional regulator [Bradyrhizobium sp. AUGA SZCCT0431]MBR1142058.1 helix-turn-helix transcriptional regulator [Bradyrhizobium sp. AUGA SZCCT0431]